MSKKSYTVILKVPGGWNEIFVADIKYEPQVGEDSYTIHKAILKLAREQCKKLNPEIRVKQMRLLLSMQGKTNVLYFGWQSGSQ